MEAWSFKGKFLMKSCQERFEPGRAWRSLWASEEDLKTLKFSHWRFGNLKELLRKIWTWQSFRRRFENLEMLSMKDWKYWRAVKEDLNLAKLQGIGELPKKISKPWSASEEDLKTLKCSQWRIGNLEELLRKIWNQSELPKKNW